ncbi:MAG: helix-turn-helix domain-containing protein [Desulfitobacterium sp.]
MFKNLRAEMAREGIKNKDLAFLFGLSNKSISNRLSGETEFTRSEMFKIQEHFFKDLTLEYLFKWDDQDAPFFKDC